MYTEWLATGPREVRSFTEVVRDQLPHDDNIKTGRYGMRAMYDEGTAMGPTCDADECHSCEHCDGMAMHIPKDEPVLVAHRGGLGQSNG